MRSLALFAGLLLAFPAAAQTAEALSAPEEVGQPVERPGARRAPARAEPMVKRGEPVVIAVRSGGLLITSQGRALGSAGAGQPIRVLSASTHRTLDGVVDGPGSVRIPVR